MSEIARAPKPAATKPRIWGALTLAFVVGLYLWEPEQAAATLSFVVSGMVDIAPLVIPGVLASAWVNASGAGGHIARVFEGNRATAILAAAAVGAITPVCGVAVLPLMAGLLASGVPLAPIMAFWLSSPVTDPAMFAVTAATLGFGFAVGKTLAAFGIGLLGGAVTAALSRFAWTRAPLRQNGIAASLGGGCGTTAPFRLAIWKEQERRNQFVKEIWAMTKLLLLCLGFAFSAEYLMQELLAPQALAAYVGNQSRWAIPLAVFVGAPAYLDGYAALPLTRGLIDHGMSQGAAMAFLVSGGVVSIWGALAIIPVLRAKPFMLYLVLAVVGSLAAGWLFEWVT
ncbi:permease [Pelagibius litoralis]|uniref:Permease n=1 Tax=Pelagibius litoralis TaxID=374515 RepID=A0A967F0S7_9PROT|nr:permease [Pelagibius litoralis]NIA70913.1 permease [Pelagibius litoralis]